MTPTITYSCWRRPEYTAITLDALRANIGAEHYRLVVAIDGDPDPDVVRIVERQKWPASMEVYQQPQHAGCNSTIRLALEHGFHGAGYVIHVEDDVELARDALGWFAWAGEQYHGNPAVFTVGAWRHNDGWLPDCGRAMRPNEHAECRLDGGFVCWGWATWADRWEVIRAGWTTGGDHELSWDHRLAEIRSERGLCQAMPMISRAVNIGSMGGTHRGHYPLPFWMGHRFAKVRPPQIGQVPEFVAI
jgi:hypothetical protein